MYSLAIVPKKRTTRWVQISVAVVSGVATLCAFFRVHQPKDVLAFSGMATESHPVWKQFAFRRFGFGDSIADLLRRFPPTQKVEFGRYAL